MIPTFDGRFESLGSGQKGKLWVNYIWISLKIGYPKI
jgi:hypothetical protein